jgi:hypothetical protein
VPSPYIGVRASKLDRYAAMKARVFILMSFVSTSGCASLFIPAPSTDVAERRAQVEALAKRHGYTCAGHPPDEPVMLIGILDENFDCDTLLKLRRCELAPSAYSYKLREDGGITFVFRQDREPHKAHLAGIDADGNFWTNHSYWELHDPEFTRLPPNKSLEQTRDR